LHISEVPYLLLLSEDWRVLADEAMKLWDTTLLRLSVPLLYMGKVEEDTGSLQDPQIALLPDDR